MKSGLAVNLNQALIETLGNKITETLAPVLALQQPFALLDFPNHPNVGDSAIWLGELAYFTRLQQRPCFVNQVRSANLAALRPSMPSGVIFLHGGGNFGDIWPAHQAFREEVISCFPDYKIVQLPQSIHFNDPAAIARSAKVIERHSDFTLLVRDLPSYDFATKHYQCEVKLCPDMAFALGSLVRPQLARKELLLLLRTDKEMVALDRSVIPADAEIADWLADDPAMRQQLVVPYFVALMRLGIKALNPNCRLATRFDLLAQARVQRGLKQLSAAERIITDRLHVHILGLLLGIPHALLDNNYGKLSRFHEAWTKEAVGVTCCSSLSQALQQRLV